MGIIILFLVVIRYVNRRLSVLPPFPATMSSWERSAASTSELLLSLVRNFPRERMAIQNILDGLGERSFGLVLLLFGLLSAVAVVPGLATITSLPLLFFGLQMLVGSRTPWLPASALCRA